MERKVKEETRTNSEGMLKVAKKPYVSPQLTEYGNVEKLTQGSGGTAADGASGMTRACL